MFPMRIVFLKMRRMKLSLLEVTCLVFAIAIYVLALSVFWFVYKAPGLKILFWTEALGLQNLKYLSEKYATNITQNSTTILCPKTGAICNFTLDKNSINEADAVWFDGRELTDRQIREIHGYPPLKLPLGHRREDQPWIFFYLESPEYKPQLFKAFPDIFNWTMTYRSDSDIPSPYGKVQRRLVKRKSGEIFKNHYNRSKLVSWTVSNCYPRSKRNEIAKQLGKFVPVDIYGRCGKYTCPEAYSSLGHGCHKYQENIYKFYLAFENSMCDDYVTEKFFDSLRSNMVPVVYGLADYASIAPPKSFINVKSFKNVKKLAEYLLWLDRNPKEYAKYFEWKEDFEVADGDDFNIWCDMCEKVAKERSAWWPKRKWWTDLRSWYFTKIPNAFNRTSSACIIDDNSLRSG